MAHAELLHCWLFHATVHLLVCGRACSHIFVARDRMRAIDGGGGEESLGAEEMLAASCFFRIDLGCADFFLCVCVCVWPAAGAA